MSELATRLSGSNDLYAHSGRQPYASINFITAHDGFTLNDLVSYNEKHNEKNGEDNRDGENNNLSWNCGVEGPTDDPPIVALRERQKRNFLATMLLSQGVPMISHGDELGRTQLGNNNAYCQDNELVVDRLEPRRRQADCCSTSRASWCTSGGRSRRCGAASISRDATSAAARTSRGCRRTAARWTTPRGRPGSCARSGMLLSGTAIEEVNERGEPITGDTVLVLLNGHTDKVAFTLPPIEGDQQWQRVFDTSDPQSADRMYKAGGRYSLQGLLGRRLQDRGAAARTAPRLGRRTGARRLSAPQGQASAMRRARRVARRTCKRSGRIMSVASQHSPATQPQAASREAPRGARAPRRVERVQPEIDGGRFPIKRTPGESVEVAATIFADGHDVIAAVLRDRPHERRDRRARRDNSLCVLCVLCALVVTSGAKRR